MGELLLTSERLIYRSSVRPKSNNNKIQQQRNGKISPDVGRELNSSASVSTRVRPTISVHVETCHGKGYKFEAPVGWTSWTILTRGEQACATLVKPGFSFVAATAYIGK